MDDLPLSDLDAFAAIARERSFRSAARKREVSASSLSDSCGASKSGSVSGFSIVRRAPSR